MGETFRTTGVVRLEKGFPGTTEGIPRRTRLSLLPERGSNERPPSVTERPAWPHRGHTSACQARPASGLLTTAKQPELTGRYRTTRSTATVLRETHGYTGHSTKRAREGNCAPANEQALAYIGSVTNRSLPPGRNQHNGQGIRSAPDACEGHNKSCPCTHIASALLLPTFPSPPRVR